MTDRPTTGVLALQGAFALHQRVLESLGQQVVQVRRPEHLEGVQRLVVPGGESTTMSMLAERSGLLEPLRELAAGGMPMLGTCAGAILLSSQIRDGRADQHSLGAIDIVTRRNGFGRQVDSFSEPVEIAGISGPAFNAVCIRAPVIDDIGDGVQVLARIDDHPALVRQGAIMVSIFHPELADDTRVHELFLSN
ncbi:MAG: pyridoxal 5'-phosphate synthase glutaminase subunit PdxT [Microthrixaceae bacterium]